MGSRKRTQPLLFDDGRFSRIVQQTAESCYRFLRRYLLPFFVAAIFTLISSFPLTHAADTSASGNSHDIDKTPVVLNIVPEKSEFECVACVIWFMCLRVRMSATKGEFRTIPANVNGNSKGFMTIYTDTLETVNERVADKIKRTYLETDKYPEIRFSLRDLKGEHGILLPQRHRFKVSGTLKLHGIEKEIVFYPDIFLDNNVIAFEGETSVRLTEFNIKIPRFMFLQVKDEISIRFNVAWDYSPHIRNASVEVIQ
jgi:polyisoprenoid-binding protein YceI